ncbi:MAG: beta-lactamase family protein [Anaerolineae bacterium]|nr:beta-lactamase family protein [Anaerolineae bacterium]
MKSAIPERFGFSSERLTRIDRVMQSCVDDGRLAGSVGEFGWGGAFSTCFWIDPAEDLYGLLMTQLTPNNHYPIAAQFKQLTYQAMIG